jgi:hypothetical protein
VKRGVTTSARKKNNTCEENSINNVKRGITTNTKKKKEVQRKE